MAGYFDSLKRKVSPKYHERLYEIYRALDTNISYKVVTTGSMASFKYSLGLAINDHDGFEVIDYNLVTHNGQINVYPHLKITGNFVFAVVKARLLNRHTGSDFTKYTIFIYEQAAQTQKRLRGVV